MLNSIIKSNDYFDLLKLKENVYVALTKKGYGANSAIIELGNLSVIIDTFSGYGPAESLKKICIELTGKPPAYVVNTHHHTDHVFGNKVFNESIFIYSIDAYNHIEQHMKKENRAYVENFHIEQRSIHFDYSLEIKGTKGKLVLHNYKNGHSISDIVIFYKELAFSGDLVFAGDPTVEKTANLENWINTLYMLKEKDFITIIPGHGMVKDKNFIDIQIEKLLTLKAVNKKGGG